IETVVASNPFYAGAQALPTPGTKEYESKRAEMVQAIIDDAVTLVSLANDAEDEMVAAREVFAQYLEVVIEADPTFEPYAMESLQEVALIGTKEALAEVTYEGFAESAATAETPYARSMTDYMAVTNAVAYGSFMLEDIEVIAGYAVMGIDVLADSDNAEVVAAGTKYDLLIGEAVDAALGALDPVAAQIDVIGQRLDLLASSDYYFSLEALAWMETQLPELRTQVDTIEVGETVTQQDIDDMKVLLTAWEEFIASLRGHVDALDTTRLVQVDVPVDQATPLFGIESAYADGAENYGKAVTVLRQEPEPEQGDLGAAWSSVKKGWSATKTGVGVTIDLLGTTVRNVARVPYGIANGNTSAEIWEDIQANSDEVWNNYQNGVSGSKTIYTANEYVEKAENTAGEVTGGAAEWGFEQIFGKGDMSFAAGWATGGVTKIGAGLFTGMAKGIYRVANKKSTDGEVALGIVEIGLSCIGGTKVIFKGSQLPGLVRGSAEGIKQSWRAMINLAKSAATAAERKKLVAEMAEMLAKKGLTSPQVEALIGNSIKVEIAEASARTLAASRDLIMKKIRDLAAAGLGAAKGNFRETIEGTLRDLLRKSFDKSLKGLAEAGAEVIGTSASAIMDNIIGGYLDSQLTGWIGEALSVPPTAAQMNGKYSGTFTISKIDGLPEGGDVEGCDIDLEQLIGQPIPMGVTLNLGEGGSGSATLVANENPTDGTATYGGGTIQMTFATDGNTMSFSGTAAFEQESIVMSGGFSMPMGEGVVMRGSWTASK
nr:hypothetical protein [Actinomycetota bacterium]